MLVISETLRGNRNNGILIALSPLLTDLPIVFLSIFVINQFSDANLILGGLSISGGLFLLYIGIQNFRVAPQPGALTKSYQHSVRKGVITNMLSPHPYIFWITIGAPIFIKAGKLSLNSSMLFIIGFYALLIGSKMALAFISDKIKDFITSSAYQYVMILMGLILIIIAGIMVYDGFNLLHQ